jgi:hypothetical protein
MKWDMKWSDRAACVGDPDREWGHMESFGRKKKVADAIQVCSSICRVQRECARFALETGQQVGVWGGVDLGITDLPLAAHKLAGLRHVMNRKDSHA